MGIESKLELYLDGYDDYNDISGDLNEKMFDLLSDLDPDQLSEEQSSMFEEILDEIEMVNEEEDGDLVDEVKKVRVDKKAKKLRARSYKKNKAKLKMKAKKYRKSSRGKMLAKKSKKMSKRGRTATGKKIVSYR